MAQEEHPQDYPQPGWVEHDPELLWQTQLRTARQVLAEARVSAREVAAIGIADQRETTLLWERTSGRPLAKAIVWQDRRTTGHCERLRAAGLEPMVREKTGLLLDPYFSATSSPGCSTRCRARAPGPSAGALLRDGRQLPALSAHGRRGARHLAA